MRMNKRGAGESSSIFGAITIFVFIIIGIILWAVISETFGGTGTIYKAWQEARLSNTKSFGEIFGNGADSPLKVLDYIFGKVPEFLIGGLSGTGVHGISPVSAGIIVIAMWFLLFVTFGDILNLFGMFSKTVAWVAAGLLTLIAANIQALKIIAAAGFAMTAIFGAAAVILSFFFIFVVFVLFNFGTNKMRSYLIYRRAQDHAIRAVAGGKKAAAGITVLKEIVDEAEKGEK